MGAFTMAVRLCVCLLVLCTTYKTPDCLVTCIGSLCVGTGMYVCSTSVFKSHLSLPAGVVKSLLLTFLPRLSPIPVPSPPSSHAYFVPSFSHTPIYFSFLPSLPPLQPYAVSSLWSPFSTIVHMLSLPDSVLPLTPACDPVLIPFYLRQTRPIFSRYLSCVIYIFQLYPLPSIFPLISTRFFSFPFCLIHVNIPPNLTSFICLPCLPFPHYTSSIPPSYLTLPPRPTQLGSRLPVSLHHFPSSLPSVSPLYTRPRMIASPPSAHTVPGSRTQYISLHSLYSVCACL